MEQLIAILNGASILILFTIIVILLFRFFICRQKNILLLIFAFILLVGSTFTNLIEHLQLSSTIDSIEDFIEILFMPIIIFSALTTTISNELEKRKISEHKFKAIFNQAFSFIGLLDRNGNVIETNGTAMNFINETIDKYKGIPFAETAWWNHSNIEQDKLRKAIELAQKGETVRFETTHYDAEGKLHYIDFSLKPVINHNETVYLIPEGRDITEIKEARIEIEQHRNHLEVLVKERTEELEAMYQEIRAINEELYEKNLELIASYKDLNDKKETIEKTIKELYATQQQLIESEKMVSIGVLSAGIAHEINNPINFINSGVIGLSKSLEKVDKINKAYLDQMALLNNPELNAKIASIDAEYNKSKYTEAIKVLLSHIETGVTRAVDIVNSLRFFVRSNSEERTQVYLHDIIDTVLIILHNEYKYNIEITKEFKLNEPVICIVGKINQVIMNIISNAIQSIPSKGEITIKTYRELNMAVVSVSDTGSGIPPELKNKIFEPFFTTKPVGKGTGLGLSISYKIIQEHNGQIIVNSVVGQGSEFIIKLPLV